MYISKNNGYIQTPKEFKMDNEDFKYMDDDSEMCGLYLDNYPYVDFEYDKGMVTKIIILEKPTLEENIIMQELTVEERLAIAEDIINFLLGL